MSYALFSPTTVRCYRSPKKGFSPCRTIYAVFCVAGNTRLLSFPFTASLLVPLTLSSPSVPAVVHGVHRNIFCDGSGHAAGRLPRQILPTRWVRRRPTGGLSVPLPGARWQRKRLESAMIQELVELTSASTAMQVSAWPIRRSTPY